MESPQILVVDNETEIFKLNLVNAGMQVFEADSGSQALMRLRNHTIDLILLDLMMEDMNGWEVLRYMRSKHLNTPVIVLSARQLESDKIETLGLGADDYVTKPFSPGELVARIQATLRRVKPSLQSTLLKCGDLVYDRAGQQIVKQDGNIALSPIESEILDLFMQSPGHVFTHEEIFRHVWKLNEFDRNSVKVYINYLRKKIEDDPAKPTRIQTIRGIGYRLLESRL